MQRHGGAADVQMLGDGGERYQLIRGHGEELSAFRIVYVTNHNFSYRYNEIRITPSPHAPSRCSMSTAPTPPLSHAAPSMRGQLNGVLFVALFAAAVTSLSELPAIAGLGLSPLIVG
ncbi:TPA: YeiH family putative sulfate export transporter, partial [Burkholderia orbicola]